jgi:hypothetical protein
VIVEDSHSHGHAGYGLHPGSGSQRPCRLTWPKPTTASRNWISIR